MRAGGKRPSGYILHGVRRAYCPVHGYEIHACVHPILTKQQYQPYISILFKIVRLREPRGRLCLFGRSEQYPRVGTRLGVRSMALRVRDT